MEQVPKFRIFVYDMNDVMEHPVSLLEKFYANDLYEKPCFVVLTFKNTCK